MKLKFNSTKISFLVLFVLSFFSQVFAQSETGFPPNYYDIIALLLLFIVILAFAGLIYFEEITGKSTSKGKPLLFSRLKKSLSSSVPVEQEEEILLDHDYDGIKELDNRIPPWYNYLFYVTIVFGIVYMLYYHVFSSDKSMYDEYKEEMHTAQIQKEELEKTGTFINAENVKLLTSPADLSSGKSIFEANCVACHRKDAGGLVGPNLTDDYWIHGGGIKNIFHTISEGVPQKGMISWKTQLNPKQIQEVASYVISLHGTNPENPKPPQGTIWKEDEKNNE
ncbi:MAG: cbb3-type cytochrome c oxidase N-terminal domain-containing protein [Ignavibacteriaceae bacterium]